MSQIVRIFEINRMLRRKRPPAKREMLEELETSEATLKRDLDLMRDQLHAPIVYDREAGGYRYTADFNLPGLWFKQDELYALLLMHGLIDQLQPGFLQDQLKPFEAKLRALVEAPAGVQMLLSRVRMLGTPLRPVDPVRFQAVCQATLERRQIRVRYFTRGRGAEGERTLSPQTLIYYRGNWYLDAWCHRNEAVQRFSVDAMRGLRVLEAAAFEPPSGASEEGEKPGYGIFGGPARELAVLRFDSTAARWVGEEEWHPKQRIVELPDGGIHLEIPYSHPQEIMMDILRHGPRVEVVGPPSLRNAVAEAHRQAAALYAAPKRSAGTARHKDDSQSAGVL